MKVKVYRAGTDNRVIIKAARNNIIHLNTINKQAEHLSFSIEDGKIKSEIQIDKHVTQTENQVNIQFTEIPGIDEYIIE